MPVRAPADTVRRPPSPPPRESEDADGPTNDEAAEDMRGCGGAGGRPSADKLLSLLLSLFSILLLLPMRSKVAAAMTERLRSLMKSAAAAARPLRLPAAAFAVEAAVGISPALAVCVLLCCCWCSCCACSFGEAPAMPRSAVAGSAPPLLRRRPTFSGLPKASIRSAFALPPIGVEFIASLGCSLKRLRGRCALWSRRNGDADEAEANCCRSKRTWLMASCSSSAAPPPPPPVAAGIASGLALPPPNPINTRAAASPSATRSTSSATLSRPAAAAAAA